MLALVFILLVLCGRLDFFRFVEITPGQYVDWRGSLSTIVTWSAALIIAPPGPMDAEPVGSAPARADVATVNLDCHPLERRPQPRFQPGRSFGSVPQQLR